MAGQETNSAERKPPVTIWMENLTKIAAVLGAFVAVGQAGSEAVRGYWQRETDRTKAAQELALTRVKESSKLAQDYIQLLMNKDVAPPDRIMLLGALSEIKDHPLQTWAKKRYDAIVQNLDAINRARDEQIRALGEKNEKEREVRVLEARIAEANEQAKSKSEDVVESGKFKEMARALSEQLARLKGEVGVVTVKVETSATVVARTETGTGVGIPDVQDKAREMTRLIERVDTRLLLSVFPASAEGNINQYLPFVKAALQEFRISDRRMAAAILATIRSEAQEFAPISDPQSDNKFRARGFIGIVGADYARMSALLGLGTRLVDYPEEANSPAVAARILCAYFLDENEKFGRGAVESGDAQVIYLRIVRGKQLNAFLQAYPKLLAQL